MMLQNCGARFLRVPWTARRSNQSILKEISPEYSLEGLMLKLKLQYFGHLMQRADSGKDPNAGKDWRQEEKGMTENYREWNSWMASAIQWTWIWANSRSWWRTEKPGVLQSIGWQRVGHDRVAEQQLDLKIFYFSDWLLTLLVISNYTVRAKWIIWYKSSCLKGVHSQSKLQTFYRLYLIRLSIWATRNFPSDSDSKESAFKWRICGFNSCVGKIPLRREWQPTPVLSGEFYGKRGLGGYGTWGREELDTTEQLILLKCGESENRVCWWLSKLNTMTHFQEKER